MVCKFAYLVALVHVDDVVAALMMKHHVATLSVICDDPVQCPLEMDKIMGVWDQCGTNGRGIDGREGEGRSAELTSDTRPLCVMSGTTYVRKNSSVCGQRVGSGG